MTIPDVTDFYFLVEKEIGSFQFQKLDLEPPPEKYLSIPIFWEIAVTESDLLVFAV